MTTPALRQNRRSTWERRYRREASNVCTLQSWPHFASQDSPRSNYPTFSRTGARLRWYKYRDREKWSRVVHLVPRPQGGADAGLHLLRESGRPPPTLLLLFQSLPTGYLLRFHNIHHTTLQQSGGFPKDSLAIKRDRAEPVQLLAVHPASPSGQAGLRSIASHRRAASDLARTSDQTASNGSTRAQSFHPLALILPPQM